MVLSNLLETNISETRNDRKPSILKYTKLNYNNKFIFLKMLVVLIFKVWVSKKAYNILKLALAVRG